MWQGLDYHISETGETSWINMNKIFYIVILVSQVRPPKQLLLKYTHDMTSLSETVRLSKNRQGHY